MPGVWAVKRRHPEHDAQRTVVQVLRLSGVPFSGSLNGVHLTAIQASLANASGMEAGDPDLTIWRAPPALPGCVGMALEMKARDLAPKTDRAGEFSGARPEQRARLEMLRANGWHVVVAYGADDALAKIRAAGYIS